MSRHEKGSKPIIHASDAMPPYFKVFISHSTRNFDRFVNLLAAKLKESGLVPWFCETGVDYGDNFVSQIETGLQEADLTMLCWSAQAAASPWTKAEWTSVLRREIEESRDNRLAVILLDDCPLPQLLTVKQYFDARTHPDVAIAKAADWALQRRNAAKPSARGREARFSTLPRQVTAFVGRTEMFDDLYERVLIQERTVLLCGGPGTGKTSLAIAFAKQYQRHFDAVVYQICGERKADSILSELAGDINKEWEELAPMEQRAQVQAWFKTRATLLILDDVWDGEILRLLPPEPFPALITSRDRLLEVSREQRIELPPFSIRESLALFTHVLDKDTVQCHQEILERFSKKMNGLPIAIAAAASVLEAARDPVTQAVSGLGVESLVTGTHDVPGLLRAAYEARPKAEQALLRGAATCARDGFPLWLAADVAGLEATESRLARDGLYQVSLLREVDREKQVFQIHALLHDAMQSFVGTNERHWHCIRISFRFQSWDKDSEAISSLLDEGYVATVWLGSEGALGNSRLPYHAFECARRTGKLAKALTFMEAMEMHSRSVGDQKNLQASIGNKALILMAWGQLNEAMQLFKAQESICRELKIRTGLGISLTNQAIILQGWERFDEAMEMHQESERICRDEKDRTGIGVCLGNQAAVLVKWNRLDEAMKLRKEEEKICREERDLAGLQRSLGCQAIILEAWGRKDESMILLKEQERICREIGEVEGIGVSLGNQGNIHCAVGRMGEAMNLYRESERICRESNDREGLAASLVNQANIHMAEGRPDEAMKINRESENIYRALGKRTKLAGNLGNQASILCRRKEYAEAMKMYQEQESIYRELEEPVRLGESLRNQAIILQIWGQLDEAMKLLKEDESIGRDFGNRFELQKNLCQQALILKIQARLDEAINLLKEEEPLCREQKEPSRLKINLRSQAEILLRLERQDEAMKVLQEQESLCRELGDKDGLAWNLLNQTAIDLEKGMPENTFNKIEEAMLLAEELESSEYKAHAHWRLSDRALVLGETEAHVKHLQEAMALFTQLGLKPQIEAIGKRFRELGSTDRSGV